MCLRMVAAYHQYQQQNAAPPQAGGLMAKIKSGIATVGSTLTGSAATTDSARGPHQQAPYDARASGGYPDNAAAWNDQKGAPQYDSGRVGVYPSNPYETSQQSRHGQDNFVKTVDTGIKNMWGKLRSIVGSYGEMNNNNMNRGNSNYGPYGYSQPGPTQAAYYPPQYGQQQRSQSAEAAGYWTQSAKTPERGYAASEGSYMGSDDNREEVRSADSVSSPLSDPAGAGAASNISPQEGSASTMYGSIMNPRGVADDYQKALANNIGDRLPSLTEGSVPILPEEQVPPEPQIFVSDGCIVLIPRPVEYFKKKKDIIEAGSQQLNVFSDFERTMTNFRAPNGG